MTDCHIVSALVSKITHIQGEIDTHYKAIKGLEAKADTLKQSLLIFDENFDLRRIKAIRRRNALFKPIKLKRLIIEILRQRQGVNLSEITTLIAKAKNLDIRLVKPKIQRVVNDLLKKGSIVALNKNDALKSDYSEPMLSLNLGLFNEVLAG